MEGQIEGSALRGFFEVVKMDHLVFKYEIYRVLFGWSDMRVDAFSDHRTCHLGKWYHERCGRFFKDRPGFQDLEFPHEEVHRFGLEAVTKFSENRPDEILLSSSAMDKASMTILEQVERIENSGETSF
jgi:hypothetical protein